MLVGGEERTAERVRRERDDEICSLSSWRKIHGIREGEKA